MINKAICSKKLLSKLGRRQPALGGIDVGVKSTRDDTHISV
jgi:hypothetical protein